MPEHRTSKKLSRGNYYPLGATVVDGGVNFAIYSRHARDVFLLLFDRPDSPASDVIRVENCTRYIWHVFVQGIQAGQLYGYKVIGDHNPAQGFRFNEHKLLADPYARAFTGKFVNADNILQAYDPRSAESDLSTDKRDSDQAVPKSIVMDDAFDWQGDRPPDIFFEDLIIYEVHLKGFTAHASSKAKNPGTYLGFIEKIPYLVDLGINAVEFLPLHEFYADDFLTDKGLTNYWGYNSIGFFAPESSYASGSTPGCQVGEFKTLVRELHRAGIEVILDVVYNHTGEGNELGPTMCFRGIDNRCYYCVTGPPNEPGRYYINYSGCGNSLNLTDPACMRMVMDSLRYWVQEMHVDGFRFDLAAALGREEGVFDKSGSFFDTISQDPVLSRVKIIAEPWDIESNRVGDFPVEWSEWNGRFRDTVRKFVKGDGGQARDFGFRLTGSADLFGDDGRRPYNSINLVTCHDGFTLWDLVSYNQKHNEANCEDNRDGTNDNNSWNCGAEGDTGDEGILRLRRQQTKNFFCHLFFSLGTPMLLGGDEFLKSQKGNNNAYCQDNAISWFDWQLADKNRDLIDFCRKAIAFRKAYPILKTKRFLAGVDTAGNNIPDIAWFGPDLQPPDWEDPELRLICYQLDGAESKGSPAPYLLFLIMNASTDTRQVRIPKNNGKQWRRVIDTSLPAGEDFIFPDGAAPVVSRNCYSAAPHCTIVLISR